VLQKQALPWKRKLKTDEISSVFSFGKKQQHEYLRFLVIPTETNFAKFAVIVAKRIVRQSVHRNYCKRFIKELFRLSCTDMAGCNLIIQVRRKFGTMQHKEVAEEFSALIKSLNLKR